MLAAFGSQVSQPESTQQGLLQPQLQGLLQQQLQGCVQPQLEGLLHSQGFFEQLQDIVFLLKINKRLLH